MLLFPYFFEDPFALEILKREFYLECAPLGVPLNIKGSIFSFNFVLDMCEISGNLHFEKACELLIIAALMFPLFYF